MTSRKSAGQPDYDQFFYQQLSRRAGRIYLFRDEYISELERTVVVETPQLGNATYLFAKPQSMDRFLAAYSRVSKDDIRRNRANIGEKLGFLGRIIHDSYPRTWTKQLRERIGETPDFAAAVARPMSAGLIRTFSLPSKMCVQPVEMVSVKKYPSEAFSWIPMESD